jgi:hypothetical protein
LAGLGLAITACGHEPRREAEVNGNAVTIDVPKIAEGAGGESLTPMAERVAVLGFLNKRNGIVRDLTLKPGQAIRIKDAVVRLRACETTAPWESEKLTGAFVQLDRQKPDGSWFRRFSGWLYKESPSLNVVEDPVYDVWPKSCAMKWPEGPAAPASPRASSKASSAKKSGGDEDAGTAPVTDEPAAPSPEPAAPAPSAPANNPA